MALLSVVPLLWPLLVAAPTSATLPATLPLSHAASVECRPEDRVELNVATWKAALKRAKTRERREEILGAMKLSLDSSASETSETADGQGPRSADVTLLGIDDLFARLGPKEQPDHVIQIRYRLDGPDEKGTMFLVQVLRPLGATGWCALGSDLSHRDDAEAGIATHALAFVPLLAPKIEAIEVQIVVAELRSNATYRQYWVVEGGRLKKIFDQKIGSLDTVDGSGLTLARSGKVSLSGNFPKRIEVSQVSKNAICDVAKSEAPCEDNERASSMTFIYDGTSYVRRR